MHIRVKIIVATVGLAALSVIAQSSNPGPFPSDQALRARFLIHRADFERLVAMANEDSHLTRIAPDFAWLDDDVSWPRSNVGISDARWNDYRYLFKAVGASNGIGRGTGPARVIFPIAWVGLVPKGYAKGLVYSQAPLSPVLKSLDEKALDEFWDGPDRSHMLVYKPVENHWYIYYEQW